MCPKPVSATNLAYGVEGRGGCGKGVPLGVPIDAALVTSGLFVTCSSHLISLSSYFQNITAFKASRFMLLMIILVLIRCGACLKFTFSAHMIILKSKIFGDILVYLH